MGGSAVESAVERKEDAIEMIKRFEKIILRLQSVIMPPFLFGGTKLYVSIEYTKIEQET